MFSRRTKIVATLGPATDQPGVLDALVAAGIDCARLNCSHGTAEDLRRRTAEVRAVADACGRSVGLLFDLQGPEAAAIGGHHTAGGARRGDGACFGGAEAASDDRIGSTSTTFRGW